MKEKSILIAMLALFLFQSQALASIPNESEILGQKAQRSTPRSEKQVGKSKPTIDAPSPAVNQAPEEISAADREREILARKAQRSVSVKEKAADKQNPAKDKSAIKPEKIAPENPAPAEDGAPSPAAPEKKTETIQPPSAAAPAKDDQPPANPNDEKKPEEAKKSDDSVKAKKATKPVRAADWEREILSGKAQRSTPMQ